MSTSSNIQSSTSIVRTIKTKQSIQPGKNKERSKHDGWERVSDKRNIAENSK